MMARAATLESLRATFDRAGHPSAAFRARALARKLAVPMPDWARKRPSGCAPLDLEALKERYERARTIDRRARLRMLARERAALAGVKCPLWAAWGSRTSTPAEATALERKAIAAPPDAPPRSQRGVIRIRGERVVVHECGKAARSFSSVAAALRAVAAL
jgi:hypothetical protein